MEGYDLTVADVARIAGCHRNTVLRYERTGHIQSKRDFNNHRRYSKLDAKKLRTLLSLRREVVSHA